MLYLFFIIKHLRENQLLDYLKCTGNTSSNRLPDEEAYAEHVKW